MLIESTAASDTIRISSGESLINDYDVASGFTLGKGAVSAKGVDKLDLPSALIAGNIASGDGMDSGLIRSHHIVNGIISFDDVNIFTSALTISNANILSVLSYLQSNGDGFGGTVAFKAGNDTYVFQNGVVDDTLIELTGIFTASGVNTTGLGVNTIWVI